jgi:hypothetical protein
MRLFLAAWPIQSPSGGSESMPARGQRLTSIDLRRKADEAKTPPAHDTYLTIGGVMEHIGITCDPVFAQACGVLAGRLAVDLGTAARMLERVAKRERLSPNELAADVVASCVDPNVYLPRALYTDGDVYGSAA